MTTLMDALRQDDATRTTTGAMTTDAPKVLKMLDAEAVTPKRNAPRKHSLTEALITYAIEHGPHIPLTDDVIAELERRGIARYRITNAVYLTKKLYGIGATAHREGRKVIAYTLHL